MRFRTPMINLYSKDLQKALSFYESLGFAETFRTPKDGDPLKVELVLDGFCLGIATVEAARNEHGLDPKGEGRWIEIAVRTDDVTKAARRLTKAGAKLLSQPHDYLDGRLKLAWVADPDGNPIQLVESRD